MIRYTPLVTLLMTFIALPINLLAKEHKHQPLGVVHHGYVGTHGMVLFN